MNPFSDLTVLSLEQATVLPYFTYRLVHDGARVIRLEHPVYGDPNRLVGDPLPGQERMNQYFLCINAGKQALTLDLSQPEGLEILDRLIVELNVDVFATNQMPNKYKKLGIDPERLRALKPGLIWLGVTGFGPEHVEAAYDPILQARGGLMEMTGEPHGDPQVLGIPLPDMGASEHAYGSLMKALYLREKTGQGSTLHISMFASTVSWLTVPITLTQSFGKTITRRGNTHQFFSPVSVYPAKDGFVYMAVGNDRQFRDLVSLDEFKSLDKPEYAKNLGRNQDAENLNMAISAITSEMTTDELIAKLKSISLPASKIQSVPEVINDPLVAPHLLRSKDPVTGAELTLAPPPYSTQFLEQNNNRLSFPPRFGEHNEEILGSLGYDPQKLGTLREKGVI